MAKGSKGGARRAMSSSPRNAGPKNMGAGPKGSISKPSPMPRPGQGK